MKDYQERLREAERALAEMFDVACENLCVYNEINLGKDKCPFRESDDKCPIGTVMDKYIKDNREEMPEVLSEVVRPFIETTRRNIEIADNIRTQMGYEISLEVLKDILEKRGYDTEEFFPEEVNDDDVF